MDKAGDVILCDNKAKNAVIASAIARLYNAVSVQKKQARMVMLFRNNALVPPNLHFLVKIQKAVFIFGTSNETKKALLASNLFRIT